MNDATRPMNMPIEIDMWVLPSLVNRVYILQYHES